MNRKCEGNSSVTRLTSLCLSSVPGTDAESNAAVRRKLSFPLSWSSDCVHAPSVTHQCIVSQGLWCAGLKAGRSLWCCALQRCSVTGCSTRKKGRSSRQAVCHVILNNTSFSIAIRSLWFHSQTAQAEFWSVWESVYICLFFPSPRCPRNCFLLTAPCVLVETCQRDLPLTHCRQLTDLKCCGVLGREQFVCRVSQVRRVAGWDASRCSVLQQQHRQHRRKLGRAVCRWRSGGSWPLEPLHPPLNAEPTVRCIWFIVFGRRKSDTPKPLM